MPQKKRVKLQGIEMQNKVKISIALDRDVFQWVERAAKGARMSTSGFINFLLSGGVQGSKTFDRVIDELFELRKSAIKEEIKVAVG